MIAKLVSTRKKKIASTITEELLVWVNSPIVALTISSPTTGIYFFKEQECRKTKL